MERPRRNGGKRWLYLLVILMALGGYISWTLLRPLPLLSPVLGTNRLALQTGTAQLVWPKTGQSAVGIAGSPILDTHGTQQPAPTASTAKLITALAVLHVKPLDPGQQGPMITLTPTDEAIYGAYAAQGGSLVKVQAGEQISEYQMLEAMMLPSANNMADSLALWAFGSLPSYTAFANNYIRQLGLSGTHVGTDASGFAPSTTSTAHDLVRIGELAMQNPALAQIVGQTTASDIPVAGTVKNLNYLLGTDNIIGVKTGNTDQAGGVYISASRITVNGKPITIVTAVAGALSLAQAMKDSLPLVQSAQANFRPTTVIRSGSIIGHYHLPNGKVLLVVTSRQLTLNTWNGGSLPANVKLKSVSVSADANQSVGSLVIPESPFTNMQSVPLVLGTTPTKPTLWWRLSHPF